MLSSTGDFGLIRGRFRVCFQSLMTHCHQGHNTIVLCPANLIFGPVWLRVKAILIPPDTLISDFAFACCFSLLIKTRPGGFYDRIR
jgi:hypothetical protein